MNQLPGAHSQDTAPPLDVQTLFSPHGLPSHGSPWGAPVTVLNIIRPTCSIHRIRSIKKPFRDEAIDK